MNEAPFSANFRLYDPNGVQVQFTVRSESDLPNTNHYINTLLGTGYSVTEPVPAEGERKYRITRWTKATQNNMETGQTDYIVHLWSDHGNFKQLTVYATTWHEGTQTVPDLAHLFNLESVPICEHTKREMVPAKAWGKCNLTAIGVPELDYDGNPKLNDNGNTRYRFLRIEGEQIAVSMDDVDEDPALAAQHRPPPKGKRKASTNGKPPTPEPRPQGTPFAWPDSRSNEGEYLLNVATEFSPDNESAANFAEWFSNMSTDSGSKKWSTSSTRPDGKEGQGQYGLAVWKLDDRYGRDSHRYILSSLMSRVVDKDFPDTIPGFKTKDIFDWLMEPDKWTNRLGAVDEYVEELKGFLLSMIPDLVPLDANDTDELRRIPF